MIYLEFIFSSGWHFIGVVLLLIIVFQGTIEIIQALWGKK